MKKDYFEIEKNKVYCCIDKEAKTIDILNIKKRKLKKICNALRVTVELDSEDRITKNILKEYESYLKRM